MSPPLWFWRAKCSWFERRVSLCPRRRERQANLEIRDGDKILGGRIGESGARPGFGGSYDFKLHCVERTPDNWIYETAIT